MSGVSMVGIRCDYDWMWKFDEEVQNDNSGSVLAELEYWNNVDEVDDISFKDLFNEFLEKVKGQEKLFDKCEEVAADFSTNMKFYKAELDSVSNEKDVESVYRDYLRYEYSQFRYFFYLVKKDFLDTLKTKYYKDLVCFFDFLKVSFQKNPKLFFYTIDELKKAIEEHNFKNLPVHARTNLLTFFLYKLICLYNISLDYDCYNNVRKEKESIENFILECFVLLAAKYPEIPGDYQDKDFEKILFGLKDKISGLEDEMAGIFFS